MSGQFTDELPEKFRSEGHVFRECGTAEAAKQFREELRAAVCAQFPEAKVTEDAIFIDDLGADSLEAVELVMAFEEEFGCEIPEGAVEQIVTVQDAINFVETHSHN